MKIILFDLGNTLEERDVLLPGARETLQAIQAMRDSMGEPVILSLASDFNMPDSPEQIPAIQEQYYEILDFLDIRSFFEPLSDRVTLSTEVGVFKPDERIFRAVIEKVSANLGFQDIVFITENQSHILAARELGIVAIHFKGPGQSTGDVDRLIDVIPIIQEALVSPTLTMGTSQK